MQRRILLAVALSSLAALGIACSQPDETPEAAPAPAPDPEALRAEAEARALAARIERDFPQHGLARAKLMRVHREPDRDAPVIGVIQRGVRLRVAAEPASTERCAGGFYAIYPEGYACSPHDLLVGAEPPEPDVTVGLEASFDQPLPYDYFTVTRQNAPKLFRQPSPEEHRAILRYMRRLQHFQEEEPKKLAAFLEGKLPDEPTKPAVIADTLERGNAIASPHVADREGQAFVRTSRGRVMFAEMLTQRSGSSFEGIELSAEHSLPIAWVNRPARPLRLNERPDGSERLVEDQELELIDRYQRLDPVPPEIRVGGHFVHQVAEARYLKEWFVSVAERHEPDFAVGDDEPWIHISVGEQTLVLYRGREPVFATLVSTGLPGHETPLGTFRVHRKFVGRTMDHIGPDTGSDSYRIEDVPWTQYFYRSIALHGAFWHDRFGTARSHGCVNLTPADARRLYFASAPRVPDSWYGVTDDWDAEKGTRVLVTR